VLRFHKERLAVLARRIRAAAGRRPRRYRRRPPAGYLLVGPILEAVEWPGLQPLHSTPPWPDANRLAHETIHERTRQGSTGRDRGTAKLLLRHTTADSRLRGRKGSQRLRAWCPICREPSGALATMSAHPRTGLTVSSSWSHRRQRVEAHRRSCQVTLPAYPGSTSATAATASLCH
jgi:hypothetical protein